MILSIIRVVIVPKGMVWLQLCPHHLNIFFRFLSYKPSAQNQFIIDVVRFLP